MSVAQFHLDMTGGESVRFTGRIVASVTGWKQNGSDRLRWHDLYVYQTTGGDIYVSVIYRTLAKRERDFLWYAALGKDPTAMSTILMQYDPLKRLLHPPRRTGRVDPRRLQAAADVGARYLQRVGELIKVVSKLHSEATRS